MIRFKNPLDLPEPLDFILVVSYTVAGVGILSAWFLFVISIFHNPLPYGVFVLFSPALLGILLLGIDRGKK